MKTQTSKKAVLLRSLLLLPLLAILLLGFSETKLIEVDTSDATEVIEKASYQEVASYNELAKKYNAVPLENRKIPLSELKVLESVYKKMTADQKQNAQPFPECLPKNVQDRASPELMKEYNSLAKKYNTMLSKSKSIQIKMKDVNRLEYIYGLMSKKQRATSVPFPNFPEPPPAPKAPGSPNEREEAAATIKQIIEEQDPYDFNSNGMQISLKNVPNSPIAPIWPDEIPSKASLNYPAPPAAPNVLQGEVTNIPTPPPPIEPLDYVIAMAKKNAKFYYEGEEITSDEAINLMKKNKDINIDSRSPKGKRPVVKLSTEPISIEN